MTEATPLASEQKPLNLSGYYIDFEPTGEFAIDLILSAVARAGKAYHSTDCWNDETPLYDDRFRGECPVDWIQNAANDAAVSIAALSASPAPSGQGVSGEVPTDAQVREAMQDAWDSFCDDAQAIPSDIRREGRKTFFVAGTWADHTAMNLRAIMERDAALSPQGLDAKEGCPVCNGDCESANPPVTFCPMRDAKEGGE